MHPKLIIATARQSQAQASLNTDSLLDEIARQGARRMLLEALRLEADAYVEQARGLRDEDGLSLVVRNGKAQARQVTVGCGTVEVEAPRVRDRRDGNRFTSAILPPYLRRSPSVERLLPILYLKGLSTSDFQSALAIVGEDATAGLSPSVIVSLKRVWEREHEEWKSRAITERFAYVFADGIHLSIRLGEDTRMCLLVLIGVAENGEKKLLAVRQVIARVPTLGGRFSTRKRCHGAAGPQAHGARARPQSEYRRHPESRGGTLPDQAKPTQGAQQHAEGGLSPPGGNVPG